MIDENASGSALLDICNRALPGAMWRAALPQLAKSDLFDLTVTRTHLGWELSIGQARQRPESKSGRTLAAALMQARQYVALKFPSRWEPTLRVDRGWTTTSVSQVLEFETCDRSWWFNQLAAAAKVSKEATSYGTQIHEAVELWVKQEVWPVTPGSQQLVRALGFIPRPTPGQVELETRFQMTLPSGVPLSGAKDIVDHRLPGLTRILDMKTHSDFKWAVPPEKVPGDLQLNLYAAHTKETTTVDCLVIGQAQLLSKDPHDVRVLSALATDETMQAAVARADAAAVRMREIAAAGALHQDAIPAKPGRESCDKYKSRDNPHGCRHALYCSAWKGKKK